MKWYEIFLKVKAHSAVNDLSNCRPLFVDNLFKAEGAGLQLSGRVLVFVIRKLQVWSRASSVGEFPSPGLTFCCDSYFTICSTPPPPPRVTTVAFKNLVILPKAQVADYSWIGIHPWPSEVRVGGLCCRGIVWEPVRETISRATHQRMLIRIHPRFLRHGWLIFGLKEWNRSTQAYLHLKRKKKVEMGYDSLNLPT